MSKPKMHKGKGYKADAMDDEELKKGTSKAEGGEPDGDEDEDEDDEDGEGESMDKALIAADDLEKGLAELERIGKRAPSRKAELLVKASRSKLSSAESAELARLASGKGSISKALEDDEIEKGIDVSPALDALASAMGKIGDALDAKIEKSLDAQGAFNEALAKAVMSLGEVVRAQNEALSEVAGKIEKALDGPAREPKAAKAAPVSMAQPKQGAPVADGDKIGPREAMAALGAAFDKALVDGNQNAIATLRDDIALVQAGGTPKSALGACTILEFVKSKKS